MRAFALISTAASLAFILTIGAVAGAEGLIRAPSGGKIYALIVGIDNYTNQPRLKGAVADAQDLAITLRNVGVSNLTLLRDAQATRKAIIVAMESLVKQAVANDLVIITFAGHGTQLREHVPGSKKDGMDEAYVLSNFVSDMNNTEPEIIIGPEVKHWLGQLEAKNVDVLFVADTCHAGGLTRMPDFRSGELTYRSAALTAAAAAAAAANLKPIMEPRDALRDESTFKRVTFLAAVDRHSKAPEVPIDIDGKTIKRGALSYAVARAIEGRGAVREGVVSRGQLFKNARQLVQQFSASKQEIVTEPTVAGALNVAVWRVGGADGPGDIRPLVRIPSPNKEPVRIAVVNADASVLSQTQQLFTPFVVVENSADADFVWDAQTKEAIVAGDVVASGIEAQNVAAVADTVRALTDLAKISEERPQTIKILPDNKLHHYREVLTVTADDVHNKYLIVFNIAGNGTVQYLFPRAGDEPRISATEWRWDDIYAREPFGADTMVVIASDQRLEELENELERLHDRRAAGLVTQAVRTMLQKAPSARVGFASFFTAP